MKKTLGKELEKEYTWMLLPRMLLPRMKAKEKGLAKKDASLL